MHAKAVYLKPNVAILLNALISTVNVTYAMTMFTSVWPLVLSLSYDLCHCSTLIKLWRLGKSLENRNHWLVALISPTWWCLANTENINQNVKNFYNDHLITKIYYENLESCSNTCVMKFCSSHKISTLDGDQ